MGTWVDSPRDANLGNNSWSLVNDRFDMSQEYARNSYDMTNQYVSEMGSWLTSLASFLPSTAPISVVEVDTPSINFSRRPDFGNVSLPTGWPTDIPAAMTLLPVPDLEEIDIPAMSFSPPTWNIPVKPTIAEHTAPSDPLPPREPVVPVAPSIRLPDAPQLADTILPPAPSITLPTFDAEVPDEILRTPAEFSWSESPYNSPIWNDLLAKVLDGIRDGGTGLAPQVYSDIWNRAMLRYQMEADKRYREEENLFAAKGFPLPPGALAGALREVSSEMSRNLTEVNGKMLETEADLAQKNTHFMLELGRQAEVVLREFHNASESRTFEAAKAIAQSSMDIYNGLIAKYNAQLERYKAQAAVYESRIKAALTGIEIFKAQVEGAKVSVEAQSLLIDIYSKQVDAVETTAKIYATQVESAKIIAEIDRVKIEAFKARIEAYVAEVGSEKVKIDLYAAENEAERTKALTYSEKVKSYVAEVEATKAKTDVNIAVLDSALKKNALLIDQYKGELSGYSAKIDMISNQTAAVVEGFKAEVAGYTAETGALSSEYEMKIKQIEVNIEEARFNLEKAVSEVDAATKGYLAVKELQLKGTETTINVGAQLAASAMGAVNASASLGSSYSGSESNSYSHGESISESHRYEHE